MVSRSKGKGLSDRQEIFCREYIKDLNAAGACRRAGYSPGSCQVTSVRLMAQPAVAKRIQELMDKRAKKLELEADDILRELMRIAFSDIGDAFDDTGELKPLSEMSAEARRVLSSYDISRFTGKEGDETVTKKVKLWDKMKALELLAKHKKLITDKVEHSGTVTLESLIAGSNDEGTNG